MGIFGDDMRDLEQMDKPDTFAEILKNIKSQEYKKESADGKAEEEGKSDESGEVVAKEKPKITFEDYEKLMQRLEKEENWEEIASQNPKAREDLRQRQQEQLFEQLGKENFRIHAGPMKSKFD